MGGRPISGPAQPLVGSPAHPLQQLGPAHKQPTANEPPTVSGPFSQLLVERWWSGKEWGKPVSGGAPREQAGGCVQQGSRVFTKATDRP